MVFFLFAGAFHLLPRQQSLAEVDQDVADTFEVVAARVLYAQMRVDRGVARRSRQRLVLLVRDVVVGLAVSVLLGQPEVDQVHDVRLVVQADQEVVRLDVSVDVVPRMAKLDPGDLLQTGLPSGPRASAPS